MTIQAELTTRLEADSTLSSLIGSRIYPAKIPVDAVYPLIRYQTDGIERSYAMSGVLDAKEADLIYDCIAERYSTARQLSAAVISSLEGYTGTLGSLLIHAIFIDDERDGRMLESADDDSLKYVVHVAVRAVYE